MITRLESGREEQDLLDLVLADSRPVPAGRPWILINMIASVDGATVLEGGATALADDDDRALFKATRAIPDAILVGASTVRAEGYGPAKLDERRSRARAERGMSEHPHLAVITGRLALDPTARLFSDPAFRPEIFTTKEAASRRGEEFSRIADLVAMDDLSPARVVEHLYDSGARVVLCEGGPTINGQLAATGLVDEVFLSVSPLLVGGRSSRIFADPELAAPLEMRLDRVMMGERILFLRYLRA